MIPDTVPLLRNRELINEVPFQFAPNPFDRDAVSALSDADEARPREDVETAETRPFVPNKRPFKDDARVVAPATARVPVAVRFPPRNVLPETSSLFEGEVVPMPTLPLESMRNLSALFVTNPILSVAGWYIPLFASPFHENEGADTVSAVLPRNCPVPLMRADPLYERILSQPVPTLKADSVPAPPVMLSILMPFSLTPEAAVPPTTRRASHVPPDVPPGVMLMRVAPDSTAADPP